MDHANTNSIDLDVGRANRSQISGRLAGRTLRSPRRANEESRAHEHDGTLAGGEKFFSLSVQFVPIKLALKAIKLSGKTVDHSAGRGSLRWLFCLF